MNEPGIPRREREVLELVYQLGKASVADVIKVSPGSPGYSSVRTLLNRLVDRGLLKTTKDGKRLVYWPTESKKRVRKKVLKQMLAKFFEGSPSELISAVLDEKSLEISAGELARITEAIESYKETAEGESP